MLTSKNILEIDYLFELLDNAITYREKSPFGRHEQIYNKCRSLINDNENDYEITKSNICLSPGITEFLLTYYIPLYYVNTYYIFNTYNT